MNPPNSTVVVTDWTFPDLRVEKHVEQRMATDPRLRDKFLSGIPAGRLGRPDDIRGLAVFLASDASSWVIGALIPLDGGNLAANAGATIGRRE